VEPDPDRAAGDVVPRRIVTFTMWH
jgi:hypothetical protein